jgi:hypothetical protein
MWNEGAMTEPFKTRAESLRDKSPHLVADVFLYPTAEGGKECAAQPGWGCPCSSTKSTDVVFWDGWPLLQTPFAPGERRRMGFFFFSGEEAAAVFRKAGKFYLWECRFVGEATVVE